MCKVIYAVKIDPKAMLPFCVIFDAFGGHERYITNNYFVMGERDMDELEKMASIDMPKRFRIYNYVSIEGLVKDEFIVGIITPMAVVEKMFEFVNDNPFM